MWKRDAFIVRYKFIIINTLIMDIMLFITVTPEYVTSRSRVRETTGLFISIVLM